MANQYISNPEEAKEYLPRYNLIYVFIAMTVLAFIVRLWFLQILQGNDLREFSEKNRIKTNKVTAPRGLLLDRNGKILVENQAGFEVVLAPQYLDNLDELANNIGPILEIDPAKIKSKVLKSRKQNGPFFLVRIKDGLSRDEVFRLKRMRLDNPGLEIRESIVRSYPMKQNGAQLYGYVGEISKRQIPSYNELYKGILTFEQGDIIGKSGLEETLEKEIRGINGVSYIQVDAHGREAVTQTPNIYGQEIKDQDPSPGNNVILTLDRDIQEAAYKAFTDLQRIGAIVAMKSNGEILAWVSTPSFDPNEFSTGISPQVWSKIVNDPFKPLRNKVIQDHTSPGSTFKPLVALAALEEKLVTPTTIVNCPGSLKFGRRLYHDHLKGGHGNITIYEALERSSNVFFYKMGISLGIEKMYNYISPLGIGSKSGIELSREVSGLMPNSEWKKAAIGEEWQLGENLSTAIGQGFITATPLQMAIAYNTIGTEGNVVKPMLIKKIMNQEGQTIKEFEPQTIRNVQQKTNTGVSISEATFKVVKEGMRRVANGDRGTAKWWKVPGVEMAGKTGTSQVMSFSADQIYAKCETRPLHMRHHGWFVAFAPADKPEITIAALAEHSCHGSTGAAPVVRDIVLAYFKKYHPEIIENALKNNRGGGGSYEATTVDGE
jgi:penicillin-binding protein 2